MGLQHSPTIIRDGLVLYLDAANPKSYPGSGSNIYNLANENITATLQGSYSFGNGTIFIENKSTVATSNLSHVQCSIVTGIKTVSIWYKAISLPSGATYLLDKRSGGLGGWIYTSGVGSNWATGDLYVNAGDRQSIAWNNFHTLNEWKNIVVIANTAATDDINFFSRFSDNEGYDVEFAIIQIYNKTLTTEEIKQNFNALRGRFGI